MGFKRVFVTGGAGYVGSLLVPSLLERGYEVVVYDLNIYDHDFEPHPNLKQVTADIRDSERLTKESEGCDAFIHLASISNDPSFDLNPELGKSINYDAFKNVVSACTSNGVKRLIVASSTSQYGIKPADLDVTEETEAEPITDYAKYKLLCEDYLKEAETGDLEYVFVRPATLCGYAPRLRLDLSINILTINALINKKIKVFGGDQMRPALNIKDMVRFYKLMLEAPKEKIHGEAFNVSYANNTIMELAQLVKKVVNDESVELVVTPSDDNRSYHVNADKMKRVLGFECKYSFEDAINSLIKAYNEGLIVDGLNNPLYHNIKRMQELGLK